VVEQDFQKIIDGCNELGLELNFSKCEIFAYGSAEEATKSIDSFCRIAPAVKILPINKLSLLGVPIHESLISEAISNKLRNFDLMRELLSFPICSSCPVFA